MLNRKIFLGGTGAGIPMRPRSGDTAAKLMAAIVGLFSGLYIFRPMLMQQPDAEQAPPKAPKAIFVTCVFYCGCISEVKID